MANEFTLAGTFKDAQQNPLYEGQYVIFRITSVGSDIEDAVAYPRESVDFLIDANGDFGGTLWINGDSGINCLYEIRDPSGQRLDVIIPSTVEATTVRYETIIELYGAGDADPQLPINQESFLLKANDLSDLASASTSRVNLGVEIGVDVATPAQGALADSAIQAGDNADTLGSGAEVSGRILSTTGSGGTVWTTASTGSGDMLSTNNLNDVASVPTSVANLGLTIGTNTQAHSATLDATTGTFTTQDQTKLDGIQALADVTDSAAVIAAGAYTVGGTTVAVLDGGTGASTESGARSSLGLEIGVDVAPQSHVTDITNPHSVTAIQTGAQEQSDDLDDIAALTPVQFDGIEFDGANWIARDSQIPNNIVAVRSASDFPTTLVDGTQYNIHGSFDMGAVSPILPAAGTRITICGIGPGSALTSAENNYTMFVDNTNSGSVQFDDLRLSVTGTNSKLFDLTNDGTGAFVLEQITMISCTNIGNLTGYAFISAFRSQDTVCTNGWTIDGNIAIMDFTQYGSFGMASGGITIAAGASLLVASRLLIQGNMTMPTGSIFSDIAPANISQDAGLQLKACQFEGDGVFFSNINEKDVKSRWTGNEFPSIPPDNTHVGGGWHIADAADEVINSTTPTVYLKVNGTTTPVDLQWFSGGTANDLTLDSSRAVNAQISGVIYFEGSNNATIQCKLVANDGTPTDIFELGQIEFTSTNAPIAYPISGIPVVITSANTVIELHAKSSTGSFTAKVHSSLFISERS